MDAKLEGQEQNLHRAILIALLDLQLILLDVEWLGYGQSRAGSSGATSGGLGALLALAFGRVGTSGPFLVSALALGSATLRRLASLDDAVALILDRNVEQHFLVEGIVNLEIDLERLVQLGGLLDDLY
jgi:hypothetical protein